MHLSLHSFQYSFIIPCIILKANLIQDFHCDFCRNFANQAFLLGTKAYILSFIPEYRRKLKKNTSYLTFCQKFKIIWFIWINSRIFEKNVSFWNPTVIFPNFREWMLERILEGIRFHGGHVPSVILSFIFSHTLFICTKNSTFGPCSRSLVIILLKTREQ